MWYVITYAENGKTKRKRVNVWQLIGFLQDKATSNEAVLIKAEKLES